MSLPVAAMSRMIYLMPSETVALVLGDRQLVIPIIRSTRRTRTLSISVDPGQGVRVLAPAGVPMAEIRSLVARKASWIESRLQQPPPQTGERAIPSHVPVFGSPTAVVVRDAARYSAELVNDVVLLGMPGEPRLGVVHALLEHLYRLETERFVTRAVPRWAPAVGRQPSRVLVRAQKTRWGSCAADGSIRFNLRLSMLSPDLADYVVVHELAHLIRRDHSPAFWTEVARVLPHHGDLRACLRRAERELPTW